MAAPIPDSEVQRLRALHRYEILDTEAEEAFDRIVGLTADALKVPVALVNLVDRDRQWGKACHGLNDSEAPREDSFCAWTILRDDVMVVPDARRDARFASNPMVLGAPHVHLYAGAPLVTPDGYRIGTLCVTDSRPRPFGERETRILTRLAAIVVDELELRLRERQLARANQHAEVLVAVSKLAETDLDPTRMASRAAELVARSLDVDWGGLVGIQGGHVTLHAKWTSPRVTPVFERLARRMISHGYGPMLGGLLSRTVVYADEAPTSGGVLRDFVDAHLRAAAWGYLGAVEGTDYAFAVVRLHDTPGWTPAQRSLFEAAVRSVSAALERHAHVRALERAALTDGLTGLGNRRAFDHDLETALACAASEGTAVTLGVIDLDGLKAVNDDQGHEHGDALLRNFGQALAAELRTGDRVYRLGGDEYALLLGHAPGADPVTLRDMVRTRVERAVEATRAVGCPLVGASLGVAVYPDDAVLGADLIRLADARMYDVKRALGRGRTTTRA